MPVIPTFDYLRILPEVEEEVCDAFRKVLHSNALILGPETENFEKEFANHLGVPHCVAVSSGTAALHLALRAHDIGPGDEVITVANTCAPTIAAIRLTGATPVLVDVCADDLMQDVSRLTSVISEKTRCILPVHLWGNGVDMTSLGEFAKANKLLVIEDCAQALGTRIDDCPVGVFGDAGCFSFYPTKNLGAYGDGGAVVTGRSDVAKRLRRLRMYGYEGSPIALEEGTNARISEIQSAILRIKLRHFRSWLERRIRVASTYDAAIKNPLIRKPIERANCTPSYHQYVIRCRERDRLMAHLRAKDIGFAIHYPIPIHQMPAYRGIVRWPLKLSVTEQACQEILSIPINEGLSDVEVESVVTALNEFEGGR